MTGAPQPQASSPTRGGFAAVIKWGFLVAAIGLLAWALVSRWDEVAPALADVGWTAFLGATGLAALALAFNALSWRAVMRSVGLAAPLADAASVFLVSQAGKYVPGAVWPVLAQAEFAREHGVSRARAMAGSLVAMVVGVVMAGAVGAVGLVIAAPGSIREYSWALVVAGVLLTLLFPGVLTPLITFAMRLLRRRGEAVEIDGRAIAASAAWSVLNWAALGAQAWLLLVPLTGGVEHAFALATGAFALSWLVGFLVVVAPAGIGPREAALVAMLAGVASAPQALALALLSRAAMSLADAAGLVVGLAFRGAAKRRDRGESSRA